MTYVNDRMIRACRRGWSSCSVRFNCLVTPQDTVGCIEIIAGVGEEGGIEREGGRRLE